MHHASCYHISSSHAPPISQLLLSLPPFPASRPQISDYHNLTQSYFLPFRASPGAFITARNCILRRRVGLSVELAIISMRAADRPPGVPGPQLCQLYPELRYNYTAEPGVEHYEAMVIQQTDVQTVLAPYS